MKGARNENNKQSKQGHVNLPKPAERDTLDSRKDNEVDHSDISYKPEKKKSQAKR